MHAHLTAELQIRIRFASVRSAHDEVDRLVAEGMRRLAGFLSRGEIGMEWFASESRAIIAAAGW